MLSSQVKLTDRVHQVLTIYQASITDLLDIHLFFGHVNYAKQHRILLCFTRCYLFSLRCCPQCWSCSGTMRAASNSSMMLLKLLHKFVQWNGRRAWTSLACTYNIKQARGSYIMIQIRSLQILVSQLALQRYSKVGSTLPARICRALFAA